MSEMLADTLRALYSAEQYDQIIAAIRRENADLIRYLDLECRKLGYSLERYDRWDGGRSGAAGQAAGSGEDTPAHDTRLVLRLRAQLLEQLDATYRRQLEDAGRRQETRLRQHLTEQFEEHHAQRLKKHVRRVFIRTLGTVLLCVAVTRGLTLLLPGPGEPAVAEGKAAQCAAPEDPSP